MRWYNKKPKEETNETNIGLRSKVSGKGRTGWLPICLSMWCCGFFWDFFFVYILHLVEDFMLTLMNWSRPNLRVTSKRYFRCLYLPSVSSDVRSDVLIGFRIAVIAADGLYKRDVFRMSLRCWNEWSERIIGKRQGIAFSAESANILISCS